MRIETWEALAALATAAGSGGGVAALLNVGGTRAQSKADAARTISDSAVELNAAYRAQVDDLRADMKAMRAEFMEAIAFRDRELSSLREQLRLAREQIADLEFEVARHSAGR